MEMIDLAIYKREKSGGRTGRRMRKEGLIPAIVYGHGHAPLNIQVTRGELERALHSSAGENALISLKIQGDDETNNLPVIIKEVQHNVITDKIDHVDFNVVSLTEKIEVHAHIHIKGEAAGVKEGGVLDVVHREIMVECFPTQIPDRIDINVSNLMIGDGIHVKDLQLPEGVECLEEPETMIVVVLAPEKEEEAVEAEGIEGEEPTSAEPEVIKKGKEDEEDKDKEE